MSSPHVFSHFRQHFIAEKAWAKDLRDSDQPRQTAAAGSKELRQDPVVKMAGLGPPRGESVTCNGVQQTVQCIAELDV
jgi:hypothetical protein